MTSTAIAVAAGKSLLAVALLPLWPLIVFKREERVLSLDEAGVSTTIGKKAGSVPWSDVARIDARDDIISITRKNANAFLVPNRAFPTPEERVQCLETIREWHRSAHSANS